MKIRSQATAALAVAGAAAQVSYTTVTYDQCESASVETMVTVTNAVTQTYCPTCEASSTVTPGHTTVYTTVYQSLCPTGLVPVTHTITESCTEATPTWTPGPSHIPQGFTTTVETCHVCEATPIPVTLTKPCDCDATSGTPVGPKPTGTPVQQITDGQIQNPGTPPAAGNTPVAPGSGSNSGTGAPAPYPTTTTTKCPGPDCRAKATGGAAIPSSSQSTPDSSTPGSPDTSSIPGTTSDVPPAYTGGASSISHGVVFSVALGVVIGALAFAL